MSSAARDTECRFTPAWQPGTDSNLQRAGKQPSSACACGWPEKECLHRVLGNGPPFLPEPCEPKAEASSAATVERKRAYRYRIIESSGCLAEQAPVDSHVIDWQHMGQEYTWTVYNFSTGEVTGSMTGAFTDKGYKTEDGHYEAD